MSHRCPFKLISNLFFLFLSVTCWWISTYFSIFVPVSVWQMAMCTRETLKLESLQQPCSVFTFSNSLINPSMEPFSLLVVGSAGPTWDFNCLPELGKHAAGFIVKQQQKTQRICQRVQHWQWLFIIFSHCAQHENKLLMAWIDVLLYHNKAKAKLKECLLLPEVWICTNKAHLLLP